ncbi:hypothetical protein MCEMSEM23_02154 [Rhabdaerophilaceae bacterium]
MFFRSDLTPEEARWSFLLGKLSQHASQSDFLMAVTLWEPATLALVTQYSVVMKPAEKLEDFFCLHYGDAIQERFGVDFTGKTFADIPEFEQIRHSLDAFRLVAIHRTPHICRVSRSQRDPKGVDYTRILFPIVKDGVTTMVIGAMLFLN